MATKSGRQFHVDKKVDGRIKHDHGMTDQMCGEEDVTVTTIRAEIWDRESCQSQDHVRRCAEDVDTGHHHQHLYQHRLTF